MLFIYAYLTTLSVAQIIYRRLIGWLMNNELERIRKEVLSRNLTWGAEENHDKPRSDSWLDRDLNPKILKYVEIQ
jgi:hypothetical protein